MVHPSHHTQHARFHHSNVAPTPPTRQSQEVDVEAQVRTDASNSDGHVRILDSLKARGHLGAHSDDHSDSMYHKPIENVHSHSSSNSMRKRKMDMNRNSYAGGEMGRSSGWSPGQEPGIDTSEPAPPYSGTLDAGSDALGHHKLHQICEITCVDYSEENMSLHRLNNDELDDFLAEPRPDWSQVRWINVNGLSWDVIRAIGNHKGLHRLAIEDLMNTRSRTKADWYSDHTFIILPLQKLMEVRPEESDSEDEIDSYRRDTATTRGVDTKGRDGEDETQRAKEIPKVMHEGTGNPKRVGAVRSLWRDIMRSRKRKQRRINSEAKSNLDGSREMSSTVNPSSTPRQLRTLQRWHSGPNLDRIQFMERNSALAQKGLAVSMEQVSIFLCADGTVISFFECSAADVENPIVRRLRTQGTILRQSGDASMLMESILDAIVDLAIPVTVAYQDTLGDLELEVLTDPAIHESKMIYVLTSEIAVLRNAIAPVVQLMGALKDHKTEVSVIHNQPGTGTVPQTEEMNRASRPSVPQHKSYYNNPAGVTITPLTVMYLGDAEDHALLIQDSYDQMRRSADNLVDLIFNTVSATQNESMKQLTLVTCFFLPLSFLTGYFGMNFATFTAVQDHSDGYFWYIAAPVSVFVLLVLLRESIMRYIGKLASKALIARSRKRRIKRIGR